MLRGGAGVQEICDGIYGESEVKKMGKENYRKDYQIAGYRFVECILCGKRYNAGRGGNGAGVRYCQALKNDWWARHIGEESEEKIHVQEKDITLCEKMKAR